MGAGEGTAADDGATRDLSRAATAKEDKVCARASLGESVREEAGAPSVGRWSCWAVGIVPAETFGLVFRVVSAGLGSLVSAGDGSTDSSLRVSG